MSKDLGRGPTDPSPRVGGGKAPERPGDQRSSPLSHDPQGVEWWGWVCFWPPSHRLYEPRLGARIRLTSHEGRSFMVRPF